MRTLEHTSLSNIYSISPKSMIERPSDASIWGPTLTTSLWEWPSHQQMMTSMSPPSPPPRRPSQ